MAEIDKIALSYFERVRARDAAGLGRLFAEDGTLGMPDGNRIAGRAAIEAFYAGMFKTSPPTPTPKTVTAQGRRAVVELVAVMPDGRANPAADVFTFDDEGLITELSIYVRQAG